MQKMIPLLVVGFAAGCSSAEKVYLPIDGTGTSALAATVDGAQVQLDRDTNTLTYNGDVGQISDSGDSVTFASGATMSLTGTDNTYSRLFVLNGANPDIGAFGVSTAAFDVPTGGATYDGEAILVVTSPDGLFDLTGNATAEVDFRSDDVEVTLDGLSGTRATGLSAPNTVDDFGSVVISDIDLVGGSLDGGTVAVTTAETDAFDGTVTGGVNGSLFGPNAEEIGGSIDATGTAASLNGGFIAAQ